MPPGEQEQSGDGVAPSSGLSAGSWGSSIDDLGEAPSPQNQADLSSNPSSAAYRLCVFGKSFYLWEPLCFHLENGNDPQLIGCLSGLKVFCRLCTSLVAV